MRDEKEESKKSCNHLGGLGDDCKLIDQTCECQKSLTCCRAETGAKCCDKSIEDQPVPTKKKFGISLPVVVIAIIVIAVVVAIALFLASKS